MVEYDNSMALELQFSVDDNVSFYVVMVMFFIHLSKVEIVEFMLKNE